MSIRSSIFFAAFFALASLLTGFCASAQSVLIHAENPEQLDTPTSTYEMAAQSTNWQRFTGELPSSNAEIWFRYQITLSWNDPRRAQNPLALTLQVKGLYDAYWDGELIGSNRYLGNSAPEFSRLMLPVGNLSDGSHWFYLRIKGQELDAGDNVSVGVYPTDLSSDFFGIHFTVIIVFMVAISSYLASGYFLYIGWRGSDVAIYRMAALTTFLTGSIIYLDRAKFLTPYPYSWQSLVDLSLAAMTVVFLLAIASYSALRLKLDRPFLWGGGAFAALAAGMAPIGPYDPDTRALLALGLYLLIMAIHAWRSGNSTGLFLGSATLAGLAALLIQPDEKMLFIGSIAILFGIELSIEIYRRAQETQRLSLLSARLRGDLLKQNIRPHFLMNTLTALMEWIETSPDEAVNFVDMLAAEFRMLIDFSERSEVSLREETELCRTHIKLMGQRLDCHITLDTDDAELDNKVPPAIFHTLIENAFNHNDFRNSSYVFKLSSETTDGGTKYELSVPVTAPKKSPLATGLGTRYVTARLEEFCGKAFRFHAEQVGSMWLSRIEILKG